MGPRAGPRSAKERHGLVRGVMDRARKEGLEEGARVVILWLDDVQWGRDALAFAKRLLTDSVFAGLPILILATARDDGIGAGPKAQLRALALLERCTRRVLGPLPPKHQRALVREELGLVGQLAKTVEQHAAGNPLFAQQIVGELVQRGALVDRGQGFALRPGAELILPEDLVQGWLTRTETFLQGRPPVEAILLGIAARLGTRIESREWHYAARAWGVPSDGLAEACSTLVERLARRNLARRKSQGWSFEHGMLREAILRREQALGRGPALHLACALGLKLRYGDAPDRQERLGRHFVGAGKPEQAIAHLVQAYLYARSSQDLESVSGLVKARMNAMSLAGVATEDPRWIRGWMAASFVARSAGHFQQHRRVLRKALKLAERGGHETLSVRIGDAQTRIQIVPMHRPGLEHLEANIILPTYLQHSPQVTEITTGNLEVLTGSRLHLTGTVTRALAKADFRGVDSQALRIEGQQFHTHTLEINKRPQILEITWEDQLGLLARDPLRVELRPVQDKPPRVELITGTSAALALLAHDTVSFGLRAEDDFGLRSIGYVWGPSGAKPEELWPDQSRQSK